MLAASLTLDTSGEELKRFVSAWIHWKPRTVVLDWPAGLTGTRGDPLVMLGEAHASIAHVNTAEFGDMTARARSVALVSNQDPKDLTNLLESGNLSMSNLS